MCSAGRSRGRAALPPGPRRTQFDPDAIAGDALLIVDTSAVVEALTAESADPLLIARLAADGDLHAPHLIDVEVLSALRGLVQAGQITADRAQDARLDFAELTITRYSHEPLADRAWELRHNVTPYDAVFVALAELTERPLVTCDARLTAVPGIVADIEVFAASAG